MIIRDNNSLTMERLENKRLAILEKKRSFSIEYVLNCTRARVDGICGRTTAKEAAVAWDTIMEEK